MREVKLYFRCAVADAPTTWNSLLLLSSNVTLSIFFKSGLKTHLFNTAYLFRQRRWIYGMALYKCIIIIIFIIINVCFFIIIVLITIIISLDEESINFVWTVLQQIWSCTPALNSLITRVRYCSQATGCATHGLGELSPHFWAASPCLTIIIVGQRMSRNSWDFWRGEKIRVLSLWGRTEVGQEWRDKGKKREWDVYSPIFRSPHLWGVSRSRCLILM